MRVSKGGLALERLTGAKPRRLVKAMTPQKIAETISAIIGAHAHELQTATVWHHPREGVEIVMYSRNLTAGHPPINLGARGFVRGTSTPVKAGRPEWGHKLPYTHGGTPGLSADTRPGDLKSGTLPSARIFFNGKAHAEVFKALAQEHKARPKNQDGHRYYSPVWNIPGPKVIRRPPARKR